jgi:hypothetical protein
VVNHVDAAEVRIAFAAVLAAAADAVLVAHHFPKLGAHPVTARPVEEIAWRQEASGGKRRGGAAETLPQQVINNSAGRRFQQLLQRSRVNIRSCGKLVLVAKAWTTLRLRQKKLGVGLLVTALAHLHLQNLAQRFDWIRFAENFFFIAVPN